MKKLITIYLVCMFVCGFVTINQAKAYQLENQFNIPDVPGSEFLSPTDLTSDGENLFILLRFTAAAPPNQQYTIVKTTQSGDLLTIFAPFDRGQSLTYHNGYLYRGHEPVGGITTTEIIKLNAEDGTRLGTLPSPVSIGKLGGLASDGTNLFAISLDKTIYTITPDSGAVINTFQPLLPGYGLGIGLAYYDQHLFASTWDTISMLDPLNGSVLDSFNPGLTTNINGITFVDDKLYVQDEHSVYVFTPEPATLLLLGLGGLALLKKRRS